MLTNRKTTTTAKAFFLVGLLVSIWATASIAYAWCGTPQFNQAGGAVLTDLMGRNCKGPCDDTGQLTLMECLDLSGKEGQCILQYCDLNTIRTLECVHCKDKNQNGKDCVYREDPDDWRRFEVIREPSNPCEDGGPFKEPHPSCTTHGIAPNGSDFGLVSTPCVTNECYGELIKRGGSGDRLRCVN